MRFVLIIRWMITKVHKPAWSADRVLKKPDLKTLVTRNNKTSNNLITLFYTQ